MHTVGWQATVPSLRGFAKCVCYRHFCASQHGAWNVDNYRDPQSLNMLFLPLKEQGHQTTALPISSPPENTSKQAYFGSCQLLHWASALECNYSSLYLRWKSKLMKATCAGRDWPSGTVILQGVNCPGSFQTDTWFMRFALWWVRGTWSPCVSKDLQVDSRTEV